jgi:hypothetical protein
MHDTAGELPYREVWRATPSSDLVFLVLVVGEADHEH